MGKTNSIFHPINKLGASGPDPKLKDELLLFGRFVGDWDILECRYLEDNGKWGVTKGEIHWGWILDGLALQDIWISVGEEVPDMGTTVRFYDPDNGIWHSTWMSPTQKVVIHFTGRRVGEEIVLEGSNSKGEPIKWIFYDIRNNEFRWRAEKSTDGGKSWFRYEEMEIRRQVSSGSS